MRKLKQFNVPLDEDEVSRIDYIADKLGKSRAQMLRSFVLGGLKDMEFLDQTGIFSAVIFTDKIMGKVKEALIDGRIKIGRNGQLEFKKK
ncbi:MAG: hypothetical protein ABSC57_05865 [Syntrophales bacterium]